MSTATTLSQAVSALALSATGELLAVGLLGESGDPAARAMINVLDVGGARSRLSFAAGPQRLAALAVSPDGKRLAAALDAGVKIFDLETGKETAGWTAHRAAVNAVAFSADGGRLLTMSNDSTARVWDLATQQRRATFSEHRGAVTAGAFSPDGALVVTLGKDKQARLWEAGTGRELRTISGGKDGFLIAQFVANGAQLRTLSTDGIVHWDVTAESRPPEQIADWLTCHVPYQLEGNTLARLPTEQLLPSECWLR